MRLSNWCTQRPIEFIPKRTKGMGIIIVDGDRARAYPVNMKQVEMYLKTHNGECGCCEKQAEYIPYPKVKELKPY